MGRAFLVLLCYCVGGPAILFADDSEIIGRTAMRRERPAITGAGIPVAQPEGLVGENAWEANPELNALTSFTWTSYGGTATNFPNAVGAESGHANNVGAGFYSTSLGVAPGVSTVDCYHAGYFTERVVFDNTVVRAQVINQSFVFIVGEVTNALYDALFDSYAVQHNVLFISGLASIGNPPQSPGSCYNGMGIGIISSIAASSVGPTTDGRAKPDMVAPDACCGSFSTPLVSGGAALLLQAGAANDGGANTASIATNSAVIKALLMNGAVKMTNWTNGFRRPLDARYGAGVLNVYNSDLQLRGGRRVAVLTNGVQSPAGGTNNIASLRGWDFSAIQTLGLNDRVAHYYFELPTNGGAYSATSTLVWKKPAGPLVNLELFLYNANSNTLVTCSTSSVDNVEHIFVPKLPPGRYDLQVFKRGGVQQIGSENYALAFDFSPVKLSVARAGTNVVVAWPASPAGFVLQGADSLAAPIVWQDASTNSILSNAMNTVTTPTSPAMRFFRLFRP